MIAIIGAGPAGSAAAYHLARANQDVTVFEEHAVVGNPIQCSGVITPALDAVLSRIPKDILVNKIKRVRFYAPNQSFFDVPIKEDYVFDRAKLDQYLAQRAVDAGAKIKLQKKFEGFSREKNLLKLKFQDSAQVADVLIGADGPHSKVARDAGLMQNRKFITGIQARAEVKIEDKHLVEIFLGYGNFGWMIPENEYAGRIGIVTDTNKREDFDRLIKLRQAKILGFQSGLIPLYNPKARTSVDNVYLVGDVAGQVKASTHGGILFGMRAAEELAKAIVEKKEYEKLWRKRLGFDLWLNLKIHQILSKFSQQDLNKLVELFGQEKLKRILAQNVRDYPSKFLLEMLLREPRLLRFGTKAF